MLIATTYTRHSGFHSFVLDTELTETVKEVNNWCLANFSLSYDMINIHHPQHDSKIIRFTIVISEDQAAEAFRKKWFISN